MGNINVNDAWNRRLLNRLEENRLTHKPVELLWTPDHVKVVGFKELTGGHWSLVGMFHDQ